MPPTVPAWLLEEPQPFTPYRTGRPALPRYAAFLVHYATHRGKSLAAAASGVTLREVNRHRSRDPPFAASSRKPTRTPAT